MVAIFRRWRDRRQASGAVERREALIRDYRQVFMTDAGQRVLADILERGGVMQPSFRGDGAGATAFREGQRYGALQIIEMINADPDAARRLAMTGNTEELFDDEH